MRPPKKSKKEYVMQMVITKKELTGALEIYLRARGLGFGEYGGSLDPSQVFCSTDALDGDGERDFEIKVNLD